MYSQIHLVWLTRPDVLHPTHATQPKYHTQIFVQLRAQDTSCSGPAEVCKRPVQGSKGEGRRQAPDEHVEGIDVHDVPAT